ncbi:hypothetical protein V7S43_001411 [Phytophthora oleae]|uniref:Zeta toxin domain-containing protein n=1 Tax=Phytophthora oleae TaxID=2107226 RepID=A0ABD3G998_9STRA
MEETIARINALRPKYVFLTAKSGAGKTFFSNRLAGYKVLELDEVVKKLGREFGMQEPEAFQVYKNTLPEPFMAAFVERIHQFFMQNSDSPVVIEGAIADTDLVRRVFSGTYAEFMFVYLYPVDVDRYVMRMMKRLKKDKENNTRSLAIWTQVTSEIEQAAYDSIEMKQFMERMAHWSMDKSALRYAYFEKNGLDMVRVDV